MSTECKSMLGVHFVCHPFVPHTVHNKLIKKLVSAQNLMNSDLKKGKSYNLVSKLYLVSFTL